MQKISHFSPYTSGKSYNIEIGISFESGIGYLAEGKSKQKKVFDSVIGDGVIAASEQI